MGKYSVRYVHAVSPSDKDVGPDIELGGFAFCDSISLGKALRKVGVLVTGARVRHFDVTGDKIAILPTHGGARGPEPYLTSNWHAIILTAIPAQDDEPLKPKKTQDEVPEAKSVVRTYTTAPKEYDYGFTSEKRVVGKDSRGRDVRLVFTLKDQVDTQRERCYSGAVYMVADVFEFDKLVSFKLVTLIEETVT